MLYCVRLYWNIVSEIREKMEFEAQVLRDEGIDLADYPRFSDGMKRMMVVASTRQALDGVYDHGKMVNASATLELLAAMFDKNAQKDLNSIMYGLGSDSYYSTSAKRALLISGVGVAALNYANKVELTPAIFVFMPLLLFVLIVRLRITMVVRNLPDVERVVVRFYKELEKVVETDGQEGFFAHPENMLTMIQDIEKEMGIWAKIREHHPAKGSDFERIDGVELFAAMRDEKLLKELLDGNRPTEAGTDSESQSLQSDSDSQ